MAESPLTAKPPRGLLGWVARVPVVFYRLGLGGLLGEGLILLNHIGRKTGAIHQVVVRVVSHDADPDIYYIASAWGFKSQWPRNLLAHPEIVVQIGRRKLTVDARPLTPEQGARVLLDYRQRHPEAARQGQGPFWGINLVEADNAACRRLCGTKCRCLGWWFSPKSETWKNQTGSLSTKSQNLTREQQYVIFQVLQQELVLHRRHPVCCAHFPGRIFRRGAQPSVQLRISPRIFEQFGQLRTMPKAHHRQELLNGQ